MMVKPGAYAPGFGRMALQAIKDGLLNLLVPGVAERKESKRIKQKRSTF